MAEKEMEVTSEVQETQETQTEAVETPSVEDLQKQIEELSADRKRLEQTVSKHAAEEQKLRGQVDSFTSMADRQDRLEEQNALMLDYLEELRGTTTETVQPQTTSHLAKLEQQRKEREVAKPQPEVDPEEIEAFYMAKSLIGIQGWDIEHPAVKKTQSMSSAKEALKVLQKAAKEENDKRINEAIQQHIKESGLTSAPAGGPSAAGQDDEAFMLSYSEGKSDDHARAMKILNKIK